MKKQSLAGLICFLGIGTLLLPACTILATTISTLIWGKLADLSNRKLLL